MSLATIAAVRKPRSRSRSLSSRTPGCRGYPTFRMPWCAGYSPVSIETCDGGVHGAAAMQVAKRVPSTAKRSSTGDVGCR